jgi:hypothetical protein
MPSEQLFHDIGPMDTSITQKARGEYVADICRSGGLAFVGFLAISSGSKYIELAGDEVDHRL